MFVVLEAAVVVRWWCGGGAVVVRWWCGGGAVVVRWWCGGGAVVVRWWIVRSTAPDRQLPQMGRRSATIIMNEFWKH
jgi:hypothetical protein